MLSVVPGSGTYGTKFDITGSGWEPGEVVTVEGFGPDGTSLGPSQDSTADAGGNIDPWDWVTSTGEPTGVYTWKATGPTFGTAEATFEVSPASEPALLTYPAVVAHTFWFGGRGFQPGEKVILSLTGPTTDTLNVRANGAGDFAAEWDSTGHAWGTYNLSAVGDKGTTASAAFHLLSLRILLPLVTHNYT
jgi:hypothetical protein